MLDEQPRDRRCAAPGHERSHPHLRGRRHRSEKETRRGGRADERRGARGGARWRLRAFRFELTALAGLTPPFGASARLRMRAGAAAAEVGRPHRGATVRVQLGKRWCRHEPDCQGSEKGETTDARGRRHSAESRAEARPRQGAFSSGPQFVATTRSCSPNDRRTGRPPRSTPASARAHRPGSRSR